MRGAPVSASTGWAMPRIIPADAGSTTIDKIMEPLDEDHPRGCGEHPTMPLTAPHTPGSSPRMRGALACIRPQRQPVGIIPADAGSTNSELVARFMSRDHPRGCGEHTDGTQTRRWKTGIIPADAGSTTRQNAPGRLRQDHPRGCGEHEYQAGRITRLWGSSPRMRGAPRDAGKRSTTDRIIPADAGSTHCEGRGNDSHEDHPRGCGEHKVRASRSVMGAGSSPRMRGAHPRAGRLPGRQGIIPADAGSTIRRTACCPI